MQNFSRRMLILKGIYLVYLVSFIPGHMSFYLFFPVPLFGICWLIQNSSNAHFVSGTFWN